MADEQRARQGYLVLADISGYTAFLTGTELEHAQAIIHELTTLIRERLAPPLRFVKLEGDAVFCYADEAAFPDGERLVELLEACYFEYSNRSGEHGARDDVPVQRLCVDEYAWTEVHRAFRHVRRAA